MVVRLTPSAVSPPSAKRTAWSSSTTDTHSIPVYGPTRIAASAPPAHGDGAGGEETGRGGQGRVDESVGCVHTSMMWAVANASQERAARFLPGSDPCRDIRRPDGRIPLFGGTLDGGGYTACK